MDNVCVIYNEGTKLLCNLDELQSSKVNVNWNMFRHTHIHHTHTPHTHTHTHTPQTHTHTPHTTHHTHTPHTTHIHSPPHTHTHIHTHTHHTHTYLKWISYLFVQMQTPLQCTRSWFISRVAAFFAEIFSLACIMCPLHYPLWLVCWSFFSSLSCLFSPSRHLLGSIRKSED